MKSIILATDKEHLKILIEKEVQENGDKCDLNHIDVSQVTEMTELFKYSSFNGDISKWKTHNVENMDHMFWNSSFNGDISKWDVSKVKSMCAIFYLSWFTQDISNWTPYSLEELDNAFSFYDALEPYWAKIEEKNKRLNAIENYLLHNYLNYNLSNSEKIIKKIKV